jgi:hypothetical protein
MKPTLAVDFDGTICEHDFPRCGKLKPGARESMVFLSKHFYIIIFSCRSTPIFGDTTTVDEMIQYLKNHKIPYDRIARSDEGKVIADIYLDDRALCFTSWQKAVKDLTDRCLL